MQLIRKTVEQSEGPKRQLAPVAKQKKNIKAKVETPLLDPEDDEEDANESSNNSAKLGGDYFDDGARIMIQDNNPSDNQKSFQNLLPSLPKKKKSIYGEVLQRPIPKVSK